MKSHSPADAKLLMGGVKGLKDAWRLGVLHFEQEKTKEDTKSTARISSIKRSKEFIFYNKFHSNFLCKTYHLRA